MSLLPIADCLVIEHRLCNCGCEHLCPAPVVHRLLASPAGEPRKLVLQPRKEGEFPLELKTTHVVRLAIPFCPVCWEPNLSWAQASSLTPARPLADEVSLLFNTSALDAEIRKALLAVGFNLSRGEGRGEGRGTRRRGGKPADTRDAYEQALDL